MTPTEIIAEKMLESRYLTWVENEDMSPLVKEAALAIRPWKKYLHKPTEKVVQIVSVDEDMEGNPIYKINVTQDLNPNTFVLFDRTVFGVPCSEIKEI